MFLEGWNPTAETETGNLTPPPTDVLDQVLLSSWSPSVPVSHHPTHGPGASVCACMSEQLVFVEVSRETWLGLLIFCPQEGSSAASEQHAWSHAAHAAACV